jgi:hypothetical protein
MKNDYDGDLIFSTIKNHLYANGNLDSKEIRAKLISEKISMDLGVIENRIDEFKKSRAYRDYTTKGQTD